MVHYYCTFFDRNYLYKGLALIDSLSQHERSRYVLYVVCMDELTRTLLDKLSIPNVVTIPFHEIEAADDALRAARDNRSVVEYLWTCTPTIILRVLERYEQIEMLAYLDADLFFFSSPAPIFDESPDASILIHEHRFPPAEQQSLKWGRFNVGLVGFRRDERGLQALRWWRERCLEWCHNRLEDGKFGDQLYLDDWPSRFEGVHVLQHLGIGVAPWNHAQYEFRSSDTHVPLVEGKEIVFYHFHSTKVITAETFAPVGNQSYPVTEQFLRFVALPYLEALQRAINLIGRVMPEFSHGFLLNNEITIHVSLVATSTVASDLYKNIGCYQLNPLTEKWSCLVTQQLCDEASAIRKSGTVPALAGEASTSCMKQGAAPAIQVKQYPRITVVTPSYNQAQYLESCMDSVLSQGYPNLEYIVLDGGSSDGSREIIQRHEKHLKFWRSGPDQGHYAAVQEGLQMATGEIMGWINSDDMLHFKGLFALAEVFEARADVEFLTGRRVGFDAVGNRHSFRCPLLRWSRDQLISAENFEHDFLVVMQEGTYWRRSLWERAGAHLDLSCKYAADFELWARFSRYAQLHTLDDLTGGFRTWGDSQRSARFLDQYREECFAVIEREHQLGLPDQPFYHEAPKVIRTVRDVSIRRALKPESYRRTQQAEFPKVSVVTICQNQGRFLEQSIHSVLSQQWPNIEYVLMDCGSIDDSPRILEQAAPYARVIQNPHKLTGAAALNYALQQTSGEVMAWLSPEDMYFKEALGTAMQIFSAKQDVEWIVGRPFSWSDSGEVMSVACLPALYARRCWLLGNINEPFVHQEAMFWRRSLWNRTGGALDIQWAAASAFELCMRFSRTAEVHSVNFMLGGYRHSTEDRYDAMTQRELIEIRKIIAREAAVAGETPNDLRPAPHPILQF